MKFKLLFFLLAASIILTTNNVKAAQNRSFTTTQNNFLIQVLAGKSVEETVTVQNLTSEEETIKAFWQSYSLPKDQVVADNFISKHSLDFAALPVDQITIEPFATANLTVDINSPESLKAGDYYGNLVLGNGSNQKDINFTVRILGTLAESISATNFHDTGHSFSFVLANSGNLSTSTSVSVQINNLVGPEAKLTFNQSLTAGQKILLSQTHRQLIPGFYQVKIDNTFGDKQTTQTLLYSFWVRPEFFIISLLTLVLTIIIFFSVRKTYRDV